MGRNFIASKMRMAAGARQEIPREEESQELINPVGLMKCDEEEATPKDILAL